MTILLIINLLILAYFIGDLALSDFITRTIKLDLGLHFLGSKITLKGRDKEIIEGIILKYTKNIMESKDKSFLPIINKIKCAYNIYGNVEELIEYLENNYGAILQANKENTEGARQDRTNEYFVSYNEHDKYITIWFSYLDHQVKIKSGSESFISLSRKEQYEKLFEILLDIKNGRANEFNYTKGVEDMFMSGLEPVLDYYYGDTIRSSILIRERKNK